MGEGRNLPLSAQKKIEWKTTDIPYVMRYMAAQRKGEITMKLENYEVHLPNYSIGDKIYDKIGPVCESYGKKVLVIGGRKALAAAYDKIRSYVEQTNLEIIGKEIYGENCTYATVEKLRAMPLYQEADMVFGVGGGKALDTVKCLCITDDKPVFAFRRSRQTAPPAHRFPLCTMRTAHF